MISAVNAGLEFTSRLNCLSSGFQLKLGLPGYKNIFLTSGLRVCRVTFSWLRPGYYPLASPMLRTVSIGKSSQRRSSTPFVGLRGLFCLNSCDNA